MQRIIDFVVKYREYITFTALVVISFSLISLGDINKIGGFRTVLIGSIGWVQSVFSWIPNPTAIRSENQALRELNLQLSSEVMKSRNALIENKKLREMLDMKNQLEYPYVIAEIVGRTTVEMRSYFTLDKGKNHGVLPGMSVRTDAGMVGVVIAAGGNYSMVESIRNSDIKVAAKVQRSGYSGLLTWEGGEDFILKNMPKSYDVKNGDIIVTSNYSNKYPSNVPIGQVIEASQEQGELFIKIRVKPFVNFSTVEQVFVLKYIPNPERNQLIEELDTKLKLRKAPPTREEKLKIHDNNKKTQKDKK